MSKLLAVLLTSCLVLGASAASAREPAQSSLTGGKCVAGLASALSRGGFTGAVPCGAKQKGQNIKLRKVGIAKDLGSTYAVYYYVHRYAASAGSEKHADERLVILRDGDYLGCYRLNPVATPKIKLNGTMVSIAGRGKDFRNKNSPSRAVTFDLHAGPPPNIWFEGKLDDFER